MNEVQRHIQTIDHPTLILIDKKFLTKEFRYYRSFYARLYNGRTPEHPRMEIPEKMDEALLLEAFCNYGHAQADKIMPVIFGKSSTLLSKTAI